MTTTKPKAHKSGLENKWRYAWSIYRNQGDELILAALGEIAMAVQRVG
jgi:hypothetical protein